MQDVKAAVKNVKSVILGQPELQIFFPLSHQWWVTDWEIFFEKIYQYFPKSKTPMFAQCAVARKDYHFSETCRES